MSNTKWKIASAILVALILLALYNRVTTEYEFQTPEGSFKIKKAMFNSLMEKVDGKGVVCSLKENVCIRAFRLGDVNG